MRKRNWKKYNRHLVAQGSISFFIDPKVFKVNAKKKRRRGRPLEFSDSLIQMLLLLKIRFRLPYRALEGFSKSLFKMKVSLPTYSSICKRVGALKLCLPVSQTSRPLCVLIDASGVKICGEGEWKTKIHGRGRPRRWMKLHIAINADTQEIIAECTTDGHTADSSMTRKLLHRVPGKIQTVVADGAYDRTSSRQVIKDLKAKALIPPPKNARYQQSDNERDVSIATIQGFGGDLKARSIWGKLSGYSRRSLVETAFSRLKRLFGDRLFSQGFEKQCIENTARCMLLNQMKG